MMPFPLADGHIHANAMATDGDIVRLARKYDVTLPAEYINADGSRQWHADDHGSFHHAYDAAVGLMRQPEDIKDVIKAALIRAHGQGCVYVEMLASGLNNYRGGAGRDDIFASNMKAMISGIREAHTETGIVAFISLAAKRHLKNGPAAAHELLDSYEAFKKSNLHDAFFITGFNMAGDEEKGNIADFHNVFSRAHKLGLGCACHAGEVRSADDVWDALNLPGVTRIGHGLRAIRDPKLMQALKDRQILVEQLLTMNEMLHLKEFRVPEDHPIQAFEAAGLYLALGSDDPGIIGTSIGDEYKKAKHKYRFSDSQRLGFTANAVRFAFAPIHVKQMLMLKLETYARENGLLMPPKAFSLGGLGHPLPLESLKIG